MRKIYLSYSVLAEYKKCPRSFCNRYLLELVPKPWDGPQRWGSPLEFGHLFHFFMERWLAGEGIDEVWDQIQEEAKSLAIANVPDDCNRSLAHLGEVIGHLREYFDDDPNKFWTPLALEPEIEWKFGEIDGWEVWWRSHFDGVGKLEDGKTVVLEHKTTSQPMKSFEKRLKPNAQVASYAYAMTNHTKWEFNGVLFTAVNTRQYKNPENYEQVRQYMVECNEFEQQEWYLDTEATIKHLLADLKAGYFPKEGGPNACTMYGSCKFMKICSNLELDKDDIIRDNYVREAWKGFAIDDK